LVSGDKTKEKIKHICREKSKFSHLEIDSESCQIKPNLDCNNVFPTVLEPNGIQFGVKSIGIFGFCVQ